MTALFVAGSVAAALAAFALLVRAMRAIDAEHQPEWRGVLDVTIPVAAVRDHSKPGETVHEIDPAADRVVGKLSVFGEFVDSSYTVGKNCLLVSAGTADVQDVNGNTILGAALRIETRNGPYIFTSPASVRSLIDALTKKAAVAWPDDFAR